jgi:glycosyltransferase involved in cell wall biosynthesis
VKRAASEITPVVLTFDEEPNIERTLLALTWAGRVVVVDSGSTDRTRDIAKSFSNVEWFERPFDTHGKQWAYAVQETGIDNMALALDADMEVTRKFLNELETEFLSSGATAGIFPIDYCVLGDKLRRSLYPPQLRLFRPDAVRIFDRGHTEVFEQISGASAYQFRASVRHDDRKDLDRWFRNHIAYTKLEEDRILHGPSRGLRDALRERGIMPIVIGALAWLRAGGFRNSDAAFHYALERAVYEMMLGLRLRESRMRARLERADIVLEPASRTGCYPAND